MAASRFLFAIDSGRFDATGLLPVHKTGIDGYGATITPS
jgi:hypothetical protein